MNEQQLHEIEFQSDNHFNLYMFSALFLHQPVINPGSFKIEEQEWRDRYKVSLGDNLSWLIKSDFLPNFWLALDQGLKAEPETGHNALKQLENMINTSGVVVLYPNIQNVDFPSDLEDPLYQDTFWKLTGEDYLAVDRRLEGMIKASSMTIREIAGLINKGMEAVAADTSIVKDFDGIVTFGCKLGSEFNVELCFDKVPPVSDDNNGRLIERTPITEEDALAYFSFDDTHKKIQSRLKHINDLVSALFQNEKIKSAPELFRYAELAVNLTMVKAFLDQNVNYISFGGKDNWRSDGEETPNNKACFEILDAETDKLFKLLDSIPKEEGVDVYSVDVDTFSIFGRNNDNKVVTPALQGYTEDILKPFSQGFERVFATRLALIDTQYVFRA